MIELERKNASAAKTCAYCAAETAVLIAGQLALGFVAGIEIVTALFLCFCVIFGPKCGVITAIAFSLLRCFIWGFYLTALILYLIYYPLFALTFGALGKIDGKAFDRAPRSLRICISVFLVAAGAACGMCAGFNLIKVSRLYAAAINILLWLICGICAALLIVYNILHMLVKRKKTDGRTLKLLTFTAVACALTACFTLLDDAITPLVTGMTAEGALAYFYASFTAMLPQTVCTALTVPALYYPITFAMTKATAKRNLY